jgi:chromosome partitioning protein
MTSPRILTVAAFKGGVGKTTVAANIAASWAHQHPDTYGLLIDLDPQGNLTEALESHVSVWGSETATELLTASGNSLDVYIDPETLTAINLTTGSIDLLPAGDALTRVEERLVTEVGGERALQRVLDGNGYDWVVIDTRPSDGRLTLNAVVAATHIISVVNPARWSAEGGVKVEGFVHKVEALKLGNAKFLGSVVNKVEGGQRVGRDLVLAGLAEAHATLLQPFIPQRSASTDGEFIGSPVVLSEKRSVAAKAFLKLSENLWQETAPKKGRRK